METTVTPNVSTTQSSADDTPDGFLIGSLVCIAVGAVLLIIGFVKLAMFAHEVRTRKSLSKKKRRHLEHMRHLERYSLRAGDSPNDVITRPVTPIDNDSVFKWDSSLVNAGYIGQDTLDRHSPVPPKLNAHMNGSNVSYSRPVSVTSVQELHMTVPNESLDIQNGGFVQDPDVNDNEIKDKYDRLADVPM